MSSGHEHTSAVSAAGQHKRPLVIALCLTATYMVVEVVAGLLVGSLALISDAGHMLTDVAGLGMALAAIQVAQTRRSPSATFGLYRLEVLAALANTLLLFAVAAYVLFEAWRRFQDPTNIPGAWLIVVASVGLAVNVASFLLLRAGARESLNVRGASLEVLSDMIGSVGVIVAGVVLITTGWKYIDPIVGVAVGLFILPRAYRLGAEALRVLLQVAPRDVDVDAVRGRLASITGVVDVHDLHVWTLTSGIRVATAHVLITDGSSSEAIFTGANTVLADEFGIEHVTLQVEPPGRHADREMIV
ncbi:MAG: cation transporter [Actinobacteria bacterium]|nr:cation transporter [Actinomycetota bacterium]